MQLKKFHGKSLAGTLARVRQAFGPEALILETRELTPDSPAARLHPEARFEVIAAQDAGGALSPAGRPAASAPPQQREGASAGNTAASARASALAAALRKAEAKGEKTAAAPAAGHAFSDKAQALSKRLGLPEPAPAGAKGRGGAEASQPARRRPDPGAIVEPLEPQSERQAAGPVRLTRLPAPPAARPAISYSLLADLGELKAQLAELIDPSARPDGAKEAKLFPPEVDLGDYRALLAMGVSHTVLAPHFRAWLQWRTAPAKLKQYLAAGEAASPASAMSGRSLREWMLRVWAAERNAENVALLASLGGAVDGIGERSAPEMTGLIGPSGAGKTCTLAKLASIKRRDNRQKIAVITLDTHRFGAADQWRRIGRLMDIDVQEASNPEELSHSMESWGQYGWIGIDTPGGMTADSVTGQLFGRVLAQCSHLQTVLVLPVTQQEQLNKQQMAKGEAMRASRIIFTKLDEAQGTPAGALGSILNLSLGEKRPVAGFCAGTRVPEDFSAATFDAAWRHVLAPGAAEGRAQGGLQ